jgi:hypothetical protein
MTLLSGRKFLLFSLLAVSASSYAELKPMADDELASYTGQAIFAIDEYQVTQADTSNVDFMRVTYGADIETNLTVDKIELGKYDRAGYTAAADIDIDNLSLGHIDATTKEYVPFQATDPYMEFAFSTNNGVREVVGFRMGFGSAQGSMTADINTLTGNVGIEIDDGTGTVAAGQLLDATGAASNIRATNIGLAGDCSANCVALSDMATLQIGELDPTNGVQAAQDMFLSYQNIDLEWAKSVNDPSQTINALQGAFINLPTSMSVTTGVLTDPARIEATRYTDASLGLF